MARRLILDTGVLIQAERNGTGELFHPGDDVAISAITAAELHLGVELADDTRRPRRQSFVDAVLAVVPVEDYTPETARIHARLMAHVRRQGKPRGAHDLIIAATAVATARVLVTTDASAGFADLPGVQAITLGLFS
ncbi:PIN domain-containing protein [Streptomyces sp. CBMA156]|uniref:PIN domain-containing protein n=1 Tax=Streptomyces sp. CBMA156 TaxID=1930280 RepID=UPI001661DE96|nr:PIN domain-containing protein [Streptomyces sp. CBMA156]MBD0673053.1 VapC toxin family PIN domain ribonuclease [Streptomyces sp. CBMA156]